MTGCFLKSILLCMVFISNTWASPWVNPIYQMKSHQPALAVNQSNDVNFSGTWAGQCEDNPAVNMTIKQSPDRLTLSYSFMEEKYVLGEIKSEASSRLYTAENGTSSANWTTDHSALIFVHYNSFINQSGNLSVFLSKVSMAFSGDQIIVKGRHYQTDNTLEDFKEETISCVYHRI